MKCFWTRVAVIAAIFHALAHCQQNCLTETKDQGTNTVSINEESCSIKPSTMLNISYIEPDTVVVSWSEDLFPSYSPDRRVNLTVYEFDIMEKISKDLFEEFTVIGTCYTLTNLEEGQDYVVQLSMGSDDLCCCAIVCSSSDSQNNATSFKFQNANSMIVASQVICEALDPQSTVADTLPFSMEIQSLTPSTVTPSFKIASSETLSFSTEQPVGMESDSSPVMPASSPIQSTTGMVPSPSIFPSGPPTGGMALSSSITSSVPPTGGMVLSSSIFPSVPPTGAGAPGSATIIGIALGGVVAIAAFVVVILVIGICCCYQRKRKSGSHGINANPSSTDGVGMYETPVNILPGSNAIENPTAYTNPVSIRYVKQTNAVQRNEGNSVTGSQPQEYEQIFSSTPGIAQPQMYETAMSINSHNLPGDGGQMYEEPKDSILQYQESQETHESAQQPYEVPVRTSSQEDQGSLQPQHQAVEPYACFASSASMNRQDRKPLTYTSLYPGTMAEPQPYTPVDRTPSPGFYSTPSEYIQPIINMKEATPPDSHQYFVLDRGQSAKQQPAGGDPLYFELENGGQRTAPINRETIENEYTEFERKDTDGNERVYFELQQKGSSVSEERPEEGLPPRPEEHPYFVFERK